MRTIRTPGKRRLVLNAISAGLTVAEAAHAAGIARSSVFDWKANDPVFAAEFEAAYSAGTDVFEAEARRRAFGESDTLLIFLLKARDPQRFARKLVEVAGDLGIQHSGAVNNIHFFMPPNGRDEPEVLDDDSVTTIDGEAEAVEAA